eukprot:2450488-Pyramimonas_sp.AAC.1
MQNRWRTHKRLMVEAARLVRDNWVSSTGDGNKSNHADGRVLRARSISRAVWRQDVALARRL